ncbi:STAS domain-containing protein [bacterium]|nr:STAS domain-containing protein [bacterium]
MSFFNIDCTRMTDLSGYNLVEVSGDVNIHYRAELEKFFKKHLKNDFKNYIVYFNNVNYMDSIGLAIIIDFYKKVVKSKKSFFIVNNSEAVKKVFELTGLHEILDIFVSLEDLKKTLKEGNV